MIAPPIAEFFARLQEAAKRASAATKETRESRAEGLGDPSGYRLGRLQCLPDPERHPLNGPILGRVEDP